MNSSVNDPDRFRLAAQNRKARFDYFIESEIEAGIVLTGSEVKSLRLGRAQLSDAYAGERNGELHLINAHIPEYAQSVKDHSHEPKRPRKLLLHRREISKIRGAIQKEGMTLIPLDIHFNEKGRAKILLGLAKGKKQHDKRETIKNREWDRQKARGLKTKD